MYHFGWKGQIRDDAKQVIEVLMSLQGSQMEIDDPTTSYIVQAWARLCMCLGQDFLPYMSVVMPPLLQSARLKPLGVRVLLEKAIACNVLSCFANKLKECFSHGLIRKAAEVRKAAVSAMPGLQLSAKLAIEKGPVERSGHQLAEDIVQALAKALYTECDIEILSSIMDALKECIHLSGPLDERLVRSISTTMQETTTMLNMMIIARDPKGNVMGNTMEFRVLMLGYPPAQRDAMSKFDLVGEFKSALSKLSVALCISSERQVELIDKIQTALSWYERNQWLKIIQGIASSIAKEFCRRLMEVDENICSSFINDNRKMMRVSYIEGQLPAFDEEDLEAAYEVMMIEADMKGISIQRGLERQILRLLFMFMLHIWSDTAAVQWGYWGYCNESCQVSVYYATIHLPDEPLD